MSLRHRSIGSYTFWHGWDEKKTIMMITTLTVIRTDLYATTMLGRTTHCGQDHSVRDCIFKKFWSLNFMFVLVYDSNWLLYLFCCFAFCFQRIGIAKTAFQNMKKARNWRKSSRRIESTWQVHGRQCHSWYDTRWRCCCCCCCWRWWGLCYNFCSLDVAELKFADLRLSNKLL